MRHYPGISLNGITDPVIRKALSEIDKALRDVSAQLANQSSAGAASSSGVVTSLSADSGADIQGDVNLVGSTAIDLTRSGQDIQIAVDADAAAFDGRYLRRDGGNTVTGNIEPDTTGVRFLGATKAFGGLAAILVHGVDSTGITVLDKLVSETVRFILDQSSGGRLAVTAAGSPNAWRATAFSDQLVAIEGITQLNELAAAGGNYSMATFGFTNLGDTTFADGEHVSVGTTTGTKIGTATSQKLGFYNATPVVQRTDAGALTDSTGGTANGTLVDVGAVPTQANINDNFADCAAKINALRTALRDLGLMA